jgi:hypothetical protein
MKSIHLIAQTTLLWKDLQNKINHLQVEKSNPLEYAQYALMETDEAIRTIKSWVITHDFDDWENEILFFKEWKPLFISKYIYFAKVVALLSALPGSGIKYKKKLYEQEFEKMHYFFLENTDFLSYYRRKATYLDLKYFLRFKYDLDTKLAIDFHNYDERFSTSHDHLIATILANDEFEIFLKSQLLLLKESTARETDSNAGLQWTASKVALTELVFALHQSNCFNGGNLGLSETVRWFETTLSIDLGNYHKTATEIRARKPPQTKFLQLLTDNLTAYLDALDD